MFRGGTVPIPHGGVLGCTTSRTDDPKRVNPLSSRQEGALAGERSFAPGYRHELVQKWIPFLPGVEQKLTAGARALDFACGAGLASIVLGEGVSEVRIFRL